MRRQRPAGEPGGFTLVEVMLALAILSISLMMLISSTSGQIMVTQYGQHLSAASDLARGKMYDLEEQLLTDGFQDTDQSLEGDFEEEGWPDISWTATVETVELPNLGATQALAGEEAEGAGSGSASAAASNPILGMMGMMGGGDSGDGNVATAGLIQSQFELVTKVLEAAIRRVTLTLTWKSANRDQDMSVIAYFTDPAAMAKVISTGGAEEETPAGGDPADSDSPPSRSPTPSPSPSPSPRGGGK